MVVAAIGNMKVVCVLLVVAWAWPCEGGWEFGGTVVAVVVVVPLAGQEDIGDIHHTQEEKDRDRDRDRDKTLCLLLGGMLHRLEMENGGLVHMMRIAVVGCTEGTLDGREAVAEVVNHMVAENVAESVVVVVVVVAVVTAETPHCEEVRAAGRGTVAHCLVVWEVAHMMDRRKTGILCCVVLSVCTKNNQHLLSPQQLIIIKIIITLVAIS